LVWRSSLLCLMVLVLLRLQIVMVRISRQV
jgi:hypothetical protein